MSPDGDGEAMGSHGKPWEATKKHTVVLICIHIIHVLMMVLEYFRINHFSEL